MTQKLELKDKEISDLKESINILESLIINEKNKF